MLLLRTVDRSDDLGAPVGRAPAKTDRCLGARGPPHKSTQLALDINGLTREREPCQTLGHVAVVHLEASCSPRAASG